MLKYYPRNFRLTNGKETERAWRGSRRMEWVFSAEQDVSTIAVHIFLPPISH